MYNAVLNGRMDKFFGYWKSADIKCREVGRTSFKEDLVSWMGAAQDRADARRQEIIAERVAIAASGVNKFVTDEEMAGVSKESK